MDWQVTKGIINTGNTCYLNACIQSLMNMNKLILNIVKYKFKNEDKENYNVIKAFKTLVLHYFSKKNNTINIGYIKEYVLNSNLKNSRKQEDADECLNDLLNKCIDTFSVKSLFSVTLEQINIKNKTSILNNELSLYVDIPRHKNINIVSCIKQYIQKYGNDNNNRIYVKSISDYLCITLKRFSIENNKYKKVTTPVKPSYLFSIDNKKCKLKSVIIHQGQTISSGHYICLVLKENTWYLCNDNRIVKMNLNKKQLEKILCHGYIWIYQKFE